VRQYPKLQRFCGTTEAKSYPGAYAGISLTDLPLEFVRLL
jgi:hypothetical protein